MDEKNSNYNSVFKAFKDQYKEIEGFSKIIGTGDYGEVREIKYGGNIFAAKLVEKKIDNSYFEKLKGPYIIKIIKILDKKIKGKDYNLIIMEKAVLRNLTTMNSHLHGQKMFKFINSPFTEIVGENLLRYFAKQIVYSLETLERNELVHFNIKPENILIKAGFKLKLSDFYFLINVKGETDQTKFIIPNDTRGYVTPEYYRTSETTNKPEPVDADTAKKQDYFALGSTLFLLKVGDQMLKYKKNYDSLTEDRIIDLLQRDRAHIQSHPLIDADFISFLCSLMEYAPEERPSFEEIYRNKWLNKNGDVIELITNSYTEGEGEENRLLKELLRSDFLLEKQEQIDRDVEKKEITKKQIIKKEKRKKKANFIFDEEI